MSNEKLDYYMNMVGEFCSTVYEDGPKVSELADTFLWKQPVENMLNSFHYDHLKLPRYQGLLLFGENGNGKHSLADAYIQSMCSKEMCFEKSVFIRLRTEDFIEKQLESVEDISCFVTALFDTCGMSGQHSFIIFDQMDHYSNLAIVSNCIADSFGAVESDKIHIICIVEDDKKIPTELSKMLLRCLCTRPDESLRKKYLENNLTYNVEDWVYGSDNIRTITLKLEDVSVTELAAMTEGFSFGKLEELIQVLKMSASSKSLGDEPSCVVYIDKDTVMQYVHMFSADVCASNGVQQVVYVNGSTPNVAAAQNVSNQDTNASNLINKGQARTVAEDLELIDLVETL